jgi:GT2 family glycosyltransferase
LTVILNYQDPDATLGVARSLLSAGTPAEDLLLVDNASQDGSLERLERELPEVPRLALEENLGFAAGMNRGLSRGISEGREFVALLNDDVLLGPACLERMVAALDASPRAGLAGAVVRRPTPGNPVSNPGGLFSRWLGTFRYLDPAAPDALPRPCDWVAGAAMVVRTRAVEEAGMLDEDFFMYCEEVEWSLRLARAGWGTVVAPDASVVHEDAGFDPMRLVPLYLQWRNHMLLLRKVLPLARRPLAMAVWVAFALRDVVGRLRAGLGDTIWVPALGTWHGLLGRSGRQGLATARARAALSGGSPRSGR